MRRPRHRRGGRAGRVPRHLEKRISVPGGRRCRSLDLGDRDPPAHRPSPRQTAADPLCPRAHGDRRLGGGRGAPRRGARRPGPGAEPALAGAASGDAGDGPGRPDDPRGGSVARHPPGDGEDAHDARPTGAEGGTRMTTTWHANADLLARYASGAIDDARAYSLEADLMAW